MTEGAHFAADWLTLREPVDHRSRAVALETRLQAALPSGPITVLDLGSGRGSNLRHLAPRLARPQTWTLLDHDRGLLDLARQTRIDNLELSLETRCLDLNRIEDLALARPELVTASAWLDLVSGDWIERFVAQLTRWNTPALIALSVDGRRAFIDASGAELSSDEDENLRQAFNDHQRQPKGLGHSPALGPDAVQVLAEALSSSGFGVELAASDWVLPADSAEASSLGIELLAGWATAAEDLAPASTRSTIRTWRQQRQASIERGEIGLRVGHRDLLALPRDGQAM